MHACICPGGITYILAVYKTAQVETEVGFCYLLNNRLVLLIGGWNSPSDSLHSTVCSDV